MELLDLSKQRPPPDILTSSTSSSSSWITSSSPSLREENNETPDENPEDDINNEDDEDIITQSITQSCLYPSPSSKLSHPRVQNIHQSVYSEHLTLPRNTSVNTKKKEERVHEIASDQQPQRVDRKTDEKEERMGRTTILSG
jgi:hypothetical protein